MIKVFPTSRMAVLVGLGSLFFFAAQIAGDAFLIYGAVYFALLLIFAVIDYRWIGDSRQCRVERHLENILSLGEMNPIWIEVNNNSGSPLVVTARDEAPIDFQVEPTILKVQIKPGESKKVNYKAKPIERGDYIFGDLYVRFSSIFGLLSRQVKIECSAPVKVYPDLLQTKQQLVLAKENRSSLIGIKKSKLLGQGQEFERLRDYVPDDSLRNVDWKATARRGSLVTREYDVEQSQNVMILIDMGRTMASRTEHNGHVDMTKADYAINASVMLASLAAQSDDRVGLFCFAGSPIAYVAPGKGKAQATVLMESLYALKPRIEESGYFENLSFLSQKQRKRSLVFLFTDLIDPDSSKRLIAGISLLTRKHLVVCVALSDYELKSIINQPPVKTDDMYVQTVALSVERERKKALAVLSGMGVVVVDASPSDLTISTVNKYLQLKREARI